MAPIEMKSLCLPPKEAYFKIVEKGEATVKAGAVKVFHQAFVGGCYIGFGGLLSMVIGGQMPSSDPGIQSFVFAALFPVNLLLILLTGGSLFTGNTAAMPAAVFEGKANWGHAIKYLVVSWVGNFLAAFMFAALTEYAELCPTDYESGTGCGYLAAKVVEKKVSKTFGQTFVKGIMCNWMVCMAVFLSSQAQDMTGKMVGIWFPISAFVMMGMEHSVANMFMLPLGLICGSHIPGYPVTVGDIFSMNMIPVTMGNFFAGCVCVAASYSYAFGKLGATVCGATDNCSALTVACNCISWEPPVDVVISTTSSLSKGGGSSACLTALDSDGDDKTREGIALAARSPAASALDRDRQKSSELADALAKHLETSKA